MCIIAYRPAGSKPLSKEMWNDCWLNHPDGAGLMFCDKENGIVIKKGAMEFEKIYKEIADLEAAKVEFAVHFRTASPGMKVTPRLTHPFFYEDSLFKVKGADDKEVPRFTWAVMHNGRLPWNPPKDESDTSSFVQSFLGPHLSRDPYFFDNETGFTWCQMAINGGQLTNKLVLLRHDRKTNKHEFYIVNEKAGEKSHGGWFSNATFRYRKSTYQGAFQDLGFYGGDTSRLANAYFATGVRLDQFRLPKDAFLVDCFGWQWSSKNDCWVMPKHKKFCAQLPYRIYPPYMHANPAPIKPPAEYERTYCHLYYYKDQGVGLDWAGLEVTDLAANSAGLTEKLTINKNGTTRTLITNTGAATYSEFTPASKSPPKEDLKSDAPEGAGNDSKNADASSEGGDAGLSKKETALELKWSAFGKNTGKIQNVRIKLNIAEIGMLCKVAVNLLCQDGFKRTEVTKMPLDEKLAALYEYYTLYIYNDTVEDAFVKMVDLAKQGKLSDKIMDGIIDSLGEKVTVINHQGFDY